MKVHAAPGSPDVASEADQTRPASGVSTSLWHPAIIVFVSNTCIMVLELVAGRMIAPYVGVSLYTWTSVIGVVLAGISLGNYAGGWLADRWASPRLLGTIFLLGGLSALGIPIAERLGNRLPDWPVTLQILLLTTVLFFLPSMVLGAVSPVVAKLAVRDLARTGRTLGGIYAAGTVGSIVGTFATGFVLISWFGTHVIVWGVAVVLLVMGVILAVGNGPLRQRGIDLALALLVVAGIAGVAARQWAWTTVCTRETSYFCIRVQESEENGQPMVTLILDRLVHSYTSLADPTRLVYMYERVFAEATQYQAQRHRPLNALFIGGGGYTFPKYMAAVYPDSRSTVIEIDPGVTQIAYERFGLEPHSPIVTYNEDARIFMSRPPTQSYDLIFGDAFNDFSVPYHLTTKEFNELVHAWLAPGGLYLVNLIDGYRHDFLRSYFHTLRQTFNYVYLVPGSHDWHTAPRMTYVLIAGDMPLELSAFQTIDAGDGERALASYVLGDQEVDQLLAEGRTVLLTDRYAPVDQMLAPMVRNEAPPLATPTPTLPAGPGN